MDPNLKPTLLALLDYDLWANRLWLEPAKQAGLDGLLWHIVRAQEVLYNRCHGLPIDLPTEGDPATKLVPMHEAWKAYLEETPLDTPITVTSPTGATFTNTVGDFVIQFINHGTYHRGEMRGKIEAMGIEFPETDYIRFVRESEAADQRDK